MNVNAKKLSVFLIISVITILACNLIVPEATPTPALEEPSSAIEDFTPSPTSPPPPTLRPPTEAPTETPPPTLTLSQADLMEAWRVPIASYALLFGVCQGTDEMLQGFDSGTSGPLDKLGASIAIGIFFEAIDQGLAEWNPPLEMQSYKDNLESSLASIRDAFEAWINDEASLEDTLNEIGESCSQVESEVENLGAIARESGLTEESLADIGQQIEDIFSGLQLDVTQEPDAAVPQGPGMSRAEPFPPAEVHSAPNWDIEVLEFVRGDEAWTMIQDANPYNDPAPEGMEYLLVKVRGVSSYDDNEEHSLAEWDFKLTGSQAIQYPTAYAITPDPALDGTVFNGGEVDGWISFLIGEGEDNLILVFDEFASFDDNRFRYFALEEGASILATEGLQEIQPTDLGVDRSDPAPFGETVVTEDWEVTLLDVVSGDEAWDTLLAANEFNDPAEPGMEYFLTRVKVRYIGSSEQAESIDDFSFQSTGSMNVLYDNPFAIPPDPALDAILYPGGEFDGWVTLLAAEGETDLMVVFAPWADFGDENQRYLAIGS
jgi:Domain of unknown function (DUF4352)